MQQRLSAGHRNLRIFGVLVYPSAMAQQIRHAFATVLARIEEMANLFFVLGKSGSACIPMMQHVVVTTYEKIRARRFNVQIQILDFFS